MKNMIRNTFGQERLRIQRLTRNNAIKDVLLIWAGIASATLGLKGFLLSNGFLDGGVTGISLLISNKTGIDLSLLIVLINLPFIFIGMKQISKQFALKTLFSVIGLSFLVHFVELPDITHDKLLIAVFGGFFLGAGIGLAIRGGSVIDGTEVLAVYVSRKSSLSVGDFIAIFNVLLFASAALLISLESAMYSMLTYLAASKTVDFLINGIEEYIGVTIVSEKADDVREAIIGMGMAVTVYKGEGGFGKRGRVETERKILFTVVTRLEVQKLKVEIEKADGDAFVIQHAVKDTKGGMIKRRPLH